MKTWQPGQPDELFFQRKPEKGLITKAEIRILSLARMALAAADVVWDIGTGSGAVAVEAAMLAPEGRVYAIEKNAEDVDIARKNVEKFRLHNVEVIHGRAPQALAQVPDDPDAVFIGGSGGEMSELVGEVIARMRPQARLVVNAITLENLAAAQQALRLSGYPYDVTLVQIARSKPILDLVRFEALNPIFILSTVKGGAAGQEGQRS